jgi:hypothetical protein
MPYEPRHDKEMHHDGKAEGVWVKFYAHIVKSPNASHAGPNDVNRECGTGGHPALPAAI